MIRRIAAVVAAMAMLLVLAVPALAGGWAEIVADGATTTPPVEDQPTEVGFTVMQHGETPAPWETATVHFTELGSGETLDVVATNDSADGHFSATAALPRAGIWTWQVTLKDLASDHAPITLSVRTASGELAPFDPAIALSAIDRAKSDVRTELTAQFAADIERLEQQAEGFRARIAYLDSAVERAAAETTGSVATDGGLPIVAVIALAVLAGAAAGFAMAWLAGRTGRPTSGVELKPAPRSADPI
jgi:hypothetical protein